MSARHHTRILLLRLCASDWMWPAIWMLPQNSTYGAWPRSGEIDVSAPVARDLVQP